MLTVLLATRNGCRTLPLVLDAYAHMQSPALGWKIILVDNGSTDQTREIVESFSNVLPLTYLYEGTLGKNSALNAGLEYVEGDLVVFSDDDAIPHQDWLIQLRTAADNNPSYTMFGGAILPRWEVQPPPWLQWVPLSPVYALTDSGIREGSIDPGLVFGPNMAIRAEVFIEGVRFDPTIGPCGTDYAMGSESELLLRLKRQGLTAWHVQAAIVEHFIREFQMDRAWVLRRAVRFGRGHFRALQASDPASVSSWLGFPSRYLLRLGKRCLRIIIALMRSDQRELFEAHWEFNYYWGCLRERIMTSSRKTGPAKTGTMG